MADIFQGIYDFLQEPYRKREAAGQVITPGPVDWGGIDATRTKVQQPQSIPELYSETGGIPPIGLQGSKVNRGATSEFWQPQTHAPDSIHYKGRPTDQVVDKSSIPDLYTVDAANPVDVNRLGLTTSPFQTPATKAIDRAAPRGPQPNDWMFHYNYLNGRQTGAPGAPQINSGDAWATPSGGDLRIGPSGGGKQGLVTGTPGGKPTPAAAPTPASSLADLFGGPPAPGTYSSNLQHNPNFGPAPGVHPHLNQFGMFD
jgi:hypothetical protein